MSCFELSLILLGASFAASLYGVYRALRSIASKTKDSQSGEIVFYMSVTMFLLFVYHWVKLGDWKSLPSFDMTVANVSIGLVVISIVSGVGVVLAMLLPAGDKPINKPLYCFFAIFVFSLAIRAVVLDNDVLVDGNGPCPKVNELWSGNGVKLKFDESFGFENVDVRDVVGEPIPFIRKNDTIIIDDTRYRDKDIIVTWTAELFGDMKTTLRRAKDRIMTTREWAPVGAFSFLLLLVLSIVMMSPNLSDDERRRVERKEKNSNGC